MTIDSDILQELKEITKQLKIVNKTLKINSIPKTDKYSNTNSTNISTEVGTDDIGKHIRESIEKAHAKARSQAYIVDNTIPEAGR